MKFLIIIFFLLIASFYYLKTYYKINITYFHLSNLLIVGLITSFVALIIIFPKVSYDSASSGLKLWFNVVIPSLLPFFIGSEILLGLGFVNFLGTFLEPIMRKVFNIPGTGAFALAMGLTSGYPTGAKVTTSLRQRELISKTEGERLLTFTNNSGLLFIMGAVSVGMFHNAKLGILLALAHYAAGLTVGILFRFYKYKEFSQNKVNTDNTNVFRKAFKQMFIAKKKDGRSLGILLGDSVKNSMNLLLLVGGFIIFFSVVISLLTELGIISYISSFLSMFLKPFNINKELINAVLSGMFEVTSGCKIAAKTSGFYINKILTAAIILGFAGFSIHLQVISIVSKTDLSPIPYLLAKTMQSIIAPIYTFILLTRFSLFKSIRVFNPMYENNISWTNIFSNSLKLFTFLLIILIVISLLLHIIKSALTVKKHR